MHTRRSLFVVTRGPTVLYLPLKQPGQCHSRATRHARPNFRLTNVAFHRAITI